MPRSEGTLPSQANGKRVRVRLFNGIDSHTLSPQGWPADGIDWSIRQPEPHPFNVQFWKLAD